MIKLRAALSEFNRHHGIEAKATLLAAGDRSFTVKIEGHFCQGCGVNEYIEDLRQALHEQGINARAKKTEEQEKARIVSFVMG